MSANDWAPVASLRRRNFDAYPVIPVGPAEQCLTGWPEIVARIRGSGAHTVVVESYPGVPVDDLSQLVAGVEPELVLDTACALRPEQEIDRLVADEVTDDPVFGRLTRLELADFFVADELAKLGNLAAQCTGRVLVLGTGASLVTRGDLLVYADLTRREATLRQRSHRVPNLGSSDVTVQPSLMYKRAYFVDWRVADRQKMRTWPQVDVFLDLTEPDWPRAVDGPVLRAALTDVAHRPFRLVPYFDPAPWGGQWMRSVFGVGLDEQQLGWCFDCVPEENSLLLGFGERRFETPAQNLVSAEPEALLGREVAARFDGQFPIRFDLLDTMDGGNLSLQVHPLTTYIREKFGMSFTQDESYYMLAADAEATVFLGLRSGVDGEAMLAALREAERGGAAFSAEQFVNQLPARRHDHFLIPAGTVHCSGRGGVVLEISATPYIFTFKLWDWGRPGLDGRPRPVHLEHGWANIRWERDTDYVRTNLVNQLTPLAAGPGWRQERTGLHEAEFIDTHRHWFCVPVEHPPGTGVNVLNLVAGEEVRVESPAGTFAPLTVHFGETFVVPAAAGEYRIVPVEAGADGQCATIKAFVRQGDTGS